MTNRDRNGRFARDPQHDAMRKAVHADLVAGLSAMEKTAMFQSLAMNDLNRNANLQCMNSFGYGYSAEALKNAMPPRRHQCLGARQLAWCKANIPGFTDILGTRDGSN